ncbi:MAG TPA: bifunctional methylenetetrahydrofolate dehydrogenase/methenyltetrahydrofolate cyclohydrolase FolD [Chlamydiales bacterium]|nr:bifunctional methylenetetrahydrofolate dehydrogenase/methenyltetrahydrofolate cyclohydrolase FolD [Chlamydiales bacterium]
MIIDGKKIAAEVIDEIKKEIDKSFFKRKPHLAFLLVGNHPASLSYIRAKKKACAQTGIEVSFFEYPADVKENDLLKEIARLNAERSVDGILVQLPLPSHIDEKKVMFSIDPEKDVDGFHPLNMGKLLQGVEGGFVPCTPLGIQELLKRSGITISGKHVVIIGRSNIVGKPLAALLMQKKEGANATVTIAHSHSKNLPLIAQSADILVAAIGKAHFVTKEMVKPGAVVIDVGINRIKEKIVGDVDFEAVSPIASYITPVPGGVGPMTIAMLLKNTYVSYQRRQ